MSLCSKMKGEFYFEDNQSLYTALKKACEHLGLPSADHRQNGKNGRSNWKSINDFYYYKNTADKMKEKYKAQIQECQISPFEKPVEFL